MIDSHVKNAKGVLIRTFEDKEMAKDFAVSNVRAYGSLSVFEVQIVKSEKPLLHARLVRQPDGTKEVSFFPRHVRRTA